MKSIVLSLLVLLLTACGGAAKRSEQDAPLVFTSPDLNWGSISSGSGGGGGNGLSAPVFFNDQTANLFDQPNSLLNGKSPNFIFESNFPSHVGGDPLREKGILNSGEWHVFTRVSNPRLVTGYSIAIQGAVDPIINTGNCSMPMSGQLTSNGLMDLCFRFNSNTSPYVAKIEVTFNRLNAAPLMVTYLMLVLPDVSAVQAAVPTCRLTLSAITIPIDGKVTARLEVSGPASAATLNGMPVSLPVHVQDLIPNRDLSGLGAQTVRADVFVSPNSPPATSCTAMFTVLPLSMEKHCASGQYAYTQCTYPNVKQILAIESFKKISDSACTRGTSFGLKAPNILWTNHGCRGDFTFDYIPF